MERSRFYARVRILKQRKDVRQGAVPDLPERNYRFAPLAGIGTLETTKVPPGIKYTAEPLY